MSNMKATNERKTNQNWISITKEKEKNTEWLSIAKENEKDSNNWISITKETEKKTNEIDNGNENKNEEVIDKNTPQEPNIDNNEMENIGNWRLSIKTDHDSWISLINDEQVKKMMNGDNHSSTETNKTKNNGSSIPIAIRSTNKTSSIKNENSPNLKSIFNNTQNFVYNKTNNTIIDNNELYLKNHTLLEKTDDSSIASSSYDEEQQQNIINKNLENLTSSVIAFDKKVLQKIDNSVSQERNNEMMKKFSNRKRTSLPGSSALHRKIK